MLDVVRYVISKDIASALESSRSDSNEDGKDGSAKFFTLLECTNVFR